MLSDYAEDKYQKAVTRFMTALAEGDKKQAKAAADEVFVYIDIRQQILAQAGRNSNPYFSNDNYATKVMLKSLEHLISAAELAHKHKRVAGRSVSLVADAKKYMSSKDAKARAENLESLVQKYSDKAHDYRIGAMSDEDVIKELRELIKQANIDFIQYSDYLDYKLTYLQDSIPYNHKSYRSIDDAAEEIDDIIALYDKKVKHGASETVGDLMSTVSHLITLSTEMIALDAKVEKHSTESINYQHQSKTFQLAIKLVDALYKLVDFVFRLADRLKSLIGLETKQEPRKNMIWNQMNKDKPNILKNLESLKEKLEDNNEKFNRILRRGNV